MKKMKMLVWVVLVLALLIGISMADNQQQGGKQNGDLTRDYCTCDYSEDLDDDGYCDWCLMCIRPLDGSGKD